ncbi:hypothetical protein ACWGK6_24560 [Streptomyces violaceusniger]
MPVEMCAGDLGEPAEFGSEDLPVVILRHGAASDQRSAVREAGDSQGGIDTYGGRVDVRGEICQVIGPFKGDQGSGVDKGAKAGERGAHTLARGLILR